MIYLNFNSAGGLDCKCGLFIVKDHVLLTIVARWSTLRFRNCGVLLCLLQNTLLIFVFYLFVLQLVRDTWSNCLMYMVSVNFRQPSQQQAMLQAGPEVAVTSVMSLHPKKSLNLHLCIYCTGTRKIEWLFLQAWCIIFLSKKQGLKRQMYSVCCPFQ